MILSPAVAALEWPFPYVDKRQANTKVPQKEPGGEKHPPGHSISFTT